LDKCRGCIICIMTIRRLELQYFVNKMSLNYEKTPVSWTNAELIPNKDDTMNLKLWEDDVEPEQISETWKRLEEKAESFRTALRYRGDHTVRMLSFGFVAYYFDEKEFFLNNEQEIADAVDILRGRRGQYKEPFMAPIPLFCDIRRKPEEIIVSLPHTMPSLPPNLHWLADTLVAAEELNKYPDLVMKLAYLVLEEIENEPLNYFRYTRNFVSHPICSDNHVITFVEAELPSARVDGGVQFRRNEKDHIAFVARYAYPALQRAKELFNEKVRAEGGFGVD
jgi:hypothetical protein